MNEETKRLLNNLSLLSSKLYDYVEDDDQIKDEEIDELDFAVRTIRMAILNIEHLEELLRYTRAVAEANQESADEAELLRIENEKQKKALDKAIEELQEAHFVSLVECIYPYYEHDKWKERLLKDE